MLRRGRVLKPIKILESRPLTREDLAMLKDRKPVVGIVAKFRESHHRIARLFALGHRVSEIIEITGYSYARLATLKQTPAFEDLIAQYSQVVIEAHERTADHFATAYVSARQKAILMVNDKLDAAIEADETLPMKDLLPIITDSADRFGYPKKSVVAHLNVGDQLQKAMVRSGRTITVDAKGAADPNRPISPSASAPVERAPLAGTSRSQGSHFKALALSSSRR